MDNSDRQQTFVLWGLKRSGIHVLVDWLFHGLGGREMTPFEGAPELHRQLRRGFQDSRQGVRFYNNCGHTHSRELALGPLRARHFERARRVHPKTIFGIEDCDFTRFHGRVPGQDVLHVLILRDPLNNIASRLEGQEKRPAVFRVDREYVDLFERFSKEFLRETSYLAPCVRVSFSSFVEDGAYRDSIARQLGVSPGPLPGRVPSFGGGSSFSGRNPSSPEELRSRHARRPIPVHIVEALLASSAIRQVCTTVFGYSLAEQSASHLQRGASDG